MTEKTNTINTVELSQMDIGILQCWVNAWAINGIEIPEDVSYKVVMDLCKKIGISVPIELTEIIDETTKKRIQAIMLSEKILEGVF